MVYIGNIQPRNDIVEGIRRSVRYQQFCASNQSQFLSDMLCDGQTGIQVPTGQTMNCRLVLEHTSLLSSGCQGLFLWE